MKSVRWLLCGLAILLSGCGPEPDTPLVLQSPNETSSGGRIQVTRLGVIKDELAYSSRRGIYLIKDTKTGTEYIGVSGIGISELGSHTRQQGKTRVTEPDER